MGWNDARIDLVAPDWRISCKEETTRAGQKISILDEIRESHPPTKRIEPDLVFDWLEEKGFVLEKPTEKTFRQGEIEAFPIVKEGELASLNLTFQLSKNSPQQWLKWNGLIELLCKTWALAPYDYRGQVRADPKDGVKLLSRTQSWMEFSNNFHWPDPTGGPLGTDKMPSSDPVPMQT